jgi:hypothetical protein
MILPKHVKAPRFAIVEESPDDEPCPPMVCRERAKTDKSTTNEGSDPFVCQIDLDNLDQDFRPSYYANLFKSLDFNLFKSVDFDHANLFKSFDDPSRAHAINITKTACPRDESPAEVNYHFNSRVEFDLANLADLPNLKASSREYEAAETSVIEMERTVEMLEARIAEQDRQLAESEALREEVLDALKREGQVRMNRILTFVAHADTKQAHKRRPRAGKWFLGACCGAPDEEEAGANLLASCYSSEDEGCSLGAFPNTEEVITVHL